jgi:hypothetical protein
VTALKVPVLNGYLQLPGDGMGGLAVKILLLTSTALNLARELPSCVDNNQLAFSA